MDSLEVVRKFYDETVNYEWERLERHKVEFELSKRFMNRYIKPNDKVLDLGGGPGRYSLYLAQRGCDVTLADLSQENVNFAVNKAKELDLPLKALQVDSRDLSTIEDGQYDYVLCMGPMYHLKSESDRVKTIKECLKKLKPGGTIFVAFVSSYSFVWDYLIHNPEFILDNERKSQLNMIVADEDFAGQGFSDNFFISPKNVLPFFDQFELEKLHLLNCESFLYLREPELLKQNPAVLNAWLDFAEQVCEREDLLSLAEHIMYIGKKTE
ncbi:class I SAM-dependent methyltransferase [Sporosarcina sp. Marseille-Q4063]|uniref:class I SAM-dependent methyltransferase n=1 Tax=Sporosarcina sp. Marseille-Q4063 TaxID=2810514 RepID=UPI001BAE66CF|nr:class I SAM-dependent methyltransferase [Sporosarcina sp. Marseille-Q4063]QUW20502.1 class I SAM-dependent methyltransferase [Sporosarcina sp. Marseille-Q4063]